MYKVFIKKSVIKFLNLHPEVKNIFKGTVNELSKDPFTDMLDIKKLNGRNNEYRLRIGKWRFLYTIHREIVTITFFDAGGRGDIYK